MNIPKRTTIYVGGPLNAALSHLSETASVSRRINAIASRYLKMVDDAMPALRAGEWLMVFDLCNGVAFPDDPRIAAMSVWMCVEDADAGMDAKWGVSAVALAGRLRAMDQDQLLAVLEVTERFWGEQRHGTWAELLAAVGARVAPEPEGVAL